MLVEKKHIEKTLTHYIQDPFQITLVVRENYQKHSLLCYEII